MLKKISLTVALSALMSGPTWSQDLQFLKPDPSFYHDSKRAINQVAKALGFVIGQRMVLEIVAQDYPEFAPKAEGFLARFQSEYGFPEHRTRWFLEDTMGEDRTTEMIEMLSTKFANSISIESKAEIDYFFDVMEKRIIGTSKEDELKTLIWLQYVTDPVLEMDHKTSRWSSTGSPKAKGAEVHLEVPYSWHRQVGSRQRVVARWGNQNGSGDMLVMLIVDDYAGKVTFEDVQNIEAEGDWSGFLPEDFELTYGKAIKVDGRPGLVYDIEGSVQSLETVHTQMMRSYMAFVDDKFVALNCSIGESDISSPSERQRDRFESLKKVCRRIAATMNFR